MNKIEKPTECSTWYPDSPDLLRTASFFTLEPQGEVWCRNADAIYASVDISGADEWAIVAHFHLQPPMVAIGFPLDCRDLALRTLFELKGSRPAFFCSASEKFEITSASPGELLDTMRNLDIGVDNIERVSTKLTDTLRRMVRPIFDHEELDDDDDGTVH